MLIFHLSFLLKIDLFNTLILQQPLAKSQPLKVKIYKYILVQQVIFSNKILRNHAHQVAKDIKFIFEGKVLKVALTLVPDFVNQLCIRSKRNCWIFPRNGNKEW